MENEAKLWGLDVDKIKDIEDIKLLFKAMDFFMLEDAPYFDEVKHLFCDDTRTPVAMTENSAGIN
jgi:hypothetical protein